MKNLILIAAVFALAACGEQRQPPPDNTVPLKTNVVSEDDVEKVEKIVPVKFPNQMNAVEMRWSQLWSALAPDEAPPQVVIDYESCDNPLWDGMSAYVAFGEQGNRYLVCVNSPDGDGIANFLEADPSVSVYSIRIINGEPQQTLIDTPDRFLFEPGGHNVDPDAEAVLDDGTIVRPDGSTYKEI